MAGSWSLDFLDLLTALNDAEAKYLLVGGHAVALFGRPRATKDFDLWIEPSPQNARRVLVALRAFGAPLGDLQESPTWRAPATDFEWAALRSGSSCCSRG